MLEASFGLVLLAMGKFEVRKAGFGLSASLNIKASLGLQFRYMTAVDIRIQLSVTLEAELTVELHLVFFSISISFKFEFKFQPTFTIKNNERPDWLAHASGYPPKSVDRGDNVLTGQAAGNSFGPHAGRALAATTVTWTAPGAMWGASFDPAFVYSGGDLRAGGKLPIDLVFATPFTIDESEKLVGAAGFVISELHGRFLQAGMFAWAAKTVLGASTTGSTVLTANDLVTLRSAIDGERHELEYATLRDFLDANFVFTIHPPTDAATVLKPAGSSQTVATIFPMRPDYKLTYGETTVVFADQTLRDAAFYANLDAYLQSLVLQVEQHLGLGDGSTGSSTVTTKPLVTHVFEAYFELLLEAGVENTIEDKAPRAEDPTTITLSLIHISEPTRPY